MRKLKVGDIAIRVKDEHCGMKVGDKAEVIELVYGNSVKLQGYEGSHAEYNLDVWHDPAPIGTGATRFTDTDGKKMVMCSMTEDTAELVRTLLGARIHGFGQVDSTTLWIHLHGLFPNGAEYEFESLQRDDAWKFKTYKPAYKLEEDDA